LPDIYTGATPTPELPSIYDTGRAPAPAPEIPSIYSGESAIPQLPDIYTTGAADAEAARLARSMTNTDNFELPDTSEYRPQRPSEVSGVGATTADKRPATPSEVSGIGVTSPSYADLIGERTGIDAPGATTPGQSYADLIGDRTGIDQPAATTSPSQSYADLIKSRLDATQGDAGQGYADEMERRIDDTVATGPGEAYADEQRRRIDEREIPQANSIQEALNRQYMDRIGGGEDPILASQLADLRKRQQDEEAATIEQLSRYGVLRGGGDTASALMQMREGQSRNRLSLEASAAQRQQQDMRDALGFDQARSQQGLAGRGMTLQERTNTESVANQRLNRQLQQAGVTGQYDGEATLQAQEQADRMLSSEAQRSAMTGGERRADIAQEAGLFGEVAGAGSAPARSTIAGLGAREQRAMSAAQRGAIGSAEQRADVAQEAGLFGEVAGQEGGAARSTMTGRQLEDQLVGSQQARELATSADRRAGVAQEAGLFGEIAGQGSDPTVRSTMAGEESDLRRQLALGAEGRADIAQQADLFGRVRPAGDGGPEVTTLGGRQASLQEELARSADERAGRAQESELFGKVTGPGAGGPDITTLGGMQALEGLRGSRMAREATEAGLTGQYEGGATVSEQNRLDALKTQDLQRRLATAGATGQLDLGGSQQPITTLAAQAQADQLLSSGQNRLIQEAGVTGLYEDEKTLQADALAEEQKSQTLQRALQRAGATGKFIEEGDTGEGVDTLENRLRTAQLTGALGDKATLAGRQADMDLVGAILASQDESLNKTEADKLKMTGIGGALASSLQAFGPAQRRAIQTALGYTPVETPTGGDTGNAGNLGLFQDQGTGLVNPLTDNQRSQARNNPLGAIDAAAADGGLTPGVLKDLPPGVLEAFLAAARDADPERQRRLAGGAI
jgi:hypothetical protein